jgi:uncharacterized membrane protein
MTKREAAQELFVAVALAASLAFAIWRAYSRLVYGTSLSGQILDYILLNHAYAFTLGMIALLGMAVWLDWRHYRRNGFFAALTPFRTTAAVVALALLVWTGFHGS